MSPPPEVDPDRTRTHPGAAAVPAWGAGEPDGFPAPGEALDGDLTVLGPLGAGGMSRVFLARDAALDREVAVKVLAPPGGADRAAWLAQFEVEARATARLSHPGVVTVYRAGRWRDRPYLVLERLRGSPLREAIRGPVPVARALALTRQVVETLGWCHRQGVAHRDLTPGNVWLGAGDRVTLLDLGLASLPGARALLGDAGTPAWTPPERGTARDDGFVVTTVPTVVNGDTTAAPDALSGVCGGDTAGEQVVEFVAPTDGRFRFDLAGTTYDAVLYALDTCTAGVPGGTELGCSDTFGGLLEVLTIDLVAGQTIEVVVDGFGVAAGAWTMTISQLPSSETTCDDGADEDGDGFSDCFDSDCDADPGCIEDCTNGVDDEGDGLVDCLDTGCATDPACAATCPEDTVTSGAPLAGDTTGRPSSVQPGCVSQVGADTTVEFTAPTAGTWGFSTNGSAYDTVLVVLDGCGGAELACDDDSGEGTRSQLSVDLLAGQTVILGVDGSSPIQQGDFVLTAFPVDATETSCTDLVDNELDGLDDCADPECVGDPACVETCAGGVDEDRDGATDCVDSDCSADPTCAPTCPTDTLAGAGSVSGDLLGRPDAETLSCGGFGPSSDATVEFTAVNTGRHRFALDPDATAFDAALGLLDACGGNELDCANGFSLVGDEWLAADLTAGDTVVVVVEAAFGDGGAWTLDVTEVPSVEATCDDGLDDDADGQFDCRDADCAADPICAASCPDDVLSNVLPATDGGTTAGALDENSPTCVGYSTAGDQSWEFTAPAAGTYTFDTVGSTYDTVLYALDGCAGAELACNDDIAPGNLRSEITLNLAAGQTVILIVDGYGVGSGAYTLNAQ